MFKYLFLCGIKYARYSMKQNFWKHNVNNIVIKAEIRNLTT